MTAVNAAADLEVVDGIAMITLDSPPVNALSATLRDGLALALDRAEAAPAVQAIVLICAGRTFIAGADIAAFNSPHAGTPLSTAQAAMETGRKPVIAAIHGTALGGGLETALACHYRIAVPSAKLGLPEVKLGILPGSGGSQRLPRLVGAEKALEMVAFGEPIGAQEALDAGLVDALAPEDDLRGAAIAFARQLVADKAPLRRVRDLDAKLQPARDRPDLFADFRKTHARRFRGFKAPEVNIKAIEWAVNLPFDEGIRKEIEAFAELLPGDQSAAQRYLFFAERQVWKVPDVPADTPTIPVRSVGVVGAGTMGGGIAMNFASAGIPVTLVETKQDALDRGLATIRRNYEATAKRGRLAPEEVEARVARVSGGLDLAALADCDLVIEAVFENMEVKKEVFARLDAVVKPGAVLATNTSALDVDEIASATRRPEAVIGLHFFSPANVMRLLEVVRGAKTSKPVIATSMQIAKRIGKIAALVGVCPGFVGNRILRARQQQAFAMLMEGVMPWRIDKVLYDFGFPMGPFAMGDLAGLDIGWNKATSKGETLRDRLCEMDRRGQKTGAGWYDYDAERKASPSPVVEQLVRDFVAEKGSTPRECSDAEILDRCLLPMINEGCRILAEGMAIRASDIDVVWVNGYSWPAYRGGPMFYGDLLGADRVVEGLRRMEREFGDAFTPSPLLLETAGSGARLRELKGAVGGAVKS